LFQGIPNILPDELFTPLLETGQFKVERIVSRGHHSPEDQWYDQTQDEWVLLLQGAAKIVIKEPSQTIHLKPGDHWLLPAHCQHRVDWTPTDQDTIWLAIHY